MGSERLSRVLGEVMVGNGWRRVIRVSRGVDGMLMIGEGRCGGLCMGRVGELGRLPKVLRGEVLCWVRRRVRGVSCLRRGLKQSDWVRGRSHE